MTDPGALKTASIEGGTLPGRAPQPVQWVRAGWLIDGQGGPARQNIMLEICAERIGRILPYHPGQALALDLAHATVLPALMDAHVHLTLSGTTDGAARKAQIKPSFEQAKKAIMGHLIDHWKCGVIAVRDGGDRQGALSACKKHHQLITELPLEVSCTCWAWHAQGRYGTMIGQAPPAGMTLSAAIAAYLEGADHIKLIHSGLNSLESFGRQTRPQFSAEELHAAVQTAHSGHRPVMVHANGEAAVRMAIDAGCDSIEHGYFMGIDNLHRMAGRGIFWVPTAVPMASLIQARGLARAQRDIAGRTLEHQIGQIQKAREIGVAIVLGTDAGSQGVDHGQAVRTELELLMAAGCTLEEAVRCATRDAARLMGYAERGALVYGRRADFIAVAGPPERMPASLQSIEIRCVGGQWFC